MKKIVWMTIALSGVGITVHAQTSVKDSMRVVNLQEVQVVSTRATAKTPVAFTNIGKAELKKVNFGQDIPYLLSMTPSTLTTSDAGAGIGYTTLRVRGTDGTRINITVNGIPMNDAESHNLFWVNMPDFSSSVKDMQVQRGAGTSTNGAGAFGASVNMQTEGASMKPYAEFNGSYGSFNTHKETVKVGTGLLNNHWTFDARLSNIGTDGYIDRASVDLNSYYLQGGYFAENTSVKLIAFAGKEKTYHAWGYATKKEMEDFGRRYNPCGEMYTDANGNKHFYDDQTDNYLQKNYQLLFNHTFSTAWNLNVAFGIMQGNVQIPGCRESMIEEKLIILLQIIIRLVVIKMLVAVGIGVHLATGVVASAEILHFLFGCVSPGVICLFFSGKCNQFHRCVFCKVASCR